MVGSSLTLKKEIMKPFRRSCDSVDKNKGFILAKFSLLIKAGMTSVWPVDLARTRGQEGDNDKVAEERGGSANTREVHSCSENERHFCLREASHFEVAVRGHVGRPAAGLPTAMRGF